MQIFNNNELPPLPILKGGTQTALNLIGISNNNQEDNIKMNFHTFKAVVLNQSSKKKENNNITIQ
jgi:hypothetical protein